MRRRNRDSSKPRPYRSVPRIAGDKARYAHVKGRLGWVIGRTSPPTYRPRNRIPSLVRYAREARPERPIGLQPREGPSIAGLGVWFASREYALSPARFPADKSYLCGGFAATIELTHYRRLTSYLQKRRLVNAGSVLASARGLGRWRWSYLGFRSLLPKYSVTTSSPIMAATISEGVRIS
jgi:hypothetical protein